MGDFDEQMAEPYQRVRTRSSPCPRPAERLEADHQVGVTTPCE
jgi:hypothetical protein